MGFKPRKRAPKPLTKKNQQDVYNLLAEVESYLTGAAMRMSLVRNKVRGTTEDLGTCPPSAPLRELDLAIDGAMLKVSSALDDLEER